MSFISFLPCKTNFNIKRNVFIRKVFHLVVVPVVGFRFHFELFGYMSAFNSVAMFGSWTSMFLVLMLLMRCYSSKCTNSIQNFLYLFGIFVFCTFHLLFFNLSDIHSLSFNFYKSFENKIEVTYYDSNLIHKPKVKVFNLYIFIFPKKSITE